MSLEPSLKRWTAAGIIGPDQAERIAAFEKERSRPTLLYAIMSIAGLAMAIGIVSIVAANWDAIPGAVKIAFDLLLLLGLGYAVVRLRERGPVWLSEASILVLYGLTLASIALVGQVYQLGGQTEVALGVWSVLTAWLMAQSKSIQLGFIWIIGLELTYFMWLAKLGDDGPREGLALMAISWPALACIALGRMSSTARAPFARVCSVLGWAQLVFLASVGTLAFYDRPRLGGAAGLWLGVGISACASAALLLTTPNSSQGRALRVLLVVAFATGHAGLLIPHGEWPLAAALGFIVLWWSVALALHRGANGSLLHAATAVIGLRLLIVYFEVFGSLLDTGVALLLGGALALVMTWFWARKRRDLDRGLIDRQAASEEAPP